jgi:uncharacterized protein with PQ loop repeat
MIGGFAISLSLVPQVYLTYKTRCADDISYLYQFIYIFGTALVNTYAIYFGLYAVYIPCLLESCLIVTLTVMKIMYPPRLDLTDQIKGSLNISRHKSLALLKQMSFEMDHEDESTARQSSLNMSRHKSVALSKRMSITQNDEDEMDAMEDKMEEEENADKRGQSQDDIEMEC